MVALTGRGVCGLAFVDDGGREEILADLNRRWKKARLIENNAQTGASIERIFPLAGQSSQEPLPLLLNGTNFQIKVWEALLRIPAGKLVSYEEIAVALGAPSSARAVSRAVATNPIAYIIPCHRVIRKMGAFGGYRWGEPRKKAILGWEMAKAAI
jgi:AraC family transcriptional regulator of adaptative response/methylated-DNA-[protein]-cysteine methyltransferase